MKINRKRKGGIVLPVYEDKNLWKFFRENDKKWLELDRSKRESQKVLKKFEIVMNTWKTYDFKKTFWTIFDCSKNKFDQLKITFDWSSSDRASIQLSKFKPNFNHNFNQSKDRFYRLKIWKKQNLKNRAILYRNSSKHNILWIECMSMRWNAFQKHLYWTQISQK